MVALLAAWQGARIARYDLALHLDLSVSFGTKISFRRLSVVTHSRNEFVMNETLAMYTRRLKEADRERLSQLSPGDCAGRT
jgi:hypothetical protein